LNWFPLVLAPRALPSQKQEAPTLSFIAHPTDNKSVLKEEQCKITEISERSQARNLSIGSRMRGVQVITYTHNDNHNNKKNNNNNGEGACGTPLEIGEATTTALPTVKANNYVNNDNDNNNNNNNTNKNNNNKQQQHQHEHQRRRRQQQR
jgi:hypothetical protein